jgi:hypothetical protein
LSPAYNAGERRIGKHAEWHEPVAGGSGAAVDRVVRDPEVVEGSVRELGTSRAIPDGPHAGGARLESIAHDYVSARVEFDTSPVETDAVGVGRAAGSNQQVGALDDTHAIIGFDVQYDPFA